MTEVVTVGVDPHRQVFTATVLDERGTKHRGTSISRSLTLGMKRS